MKGEMVVRRSADGGFRDMAGDGLSGVMPFQPSIEAEQRDLNGCDDQGACRLSMK